MFTGLISKNSFQSGKSQANLDADVGSVQFKMNDDSYKSEFSYDFQNLHNGADYEQKKEQNRKAAKKSRSH